MLDAGAAKVVRRAAGPFFAAMRDLVRREVADAMQTMLTLTGATTKPKKRKKAKNGRRKRRGPGRPPKNAS